MAEKYTRIRPKGGHSGDGFMSHGEVTVAQSIASIRSYADALRSRLALIDATADHEFSIDIVRGSIVEKFVRHVQKPTKETTQ
jgi:hypothetical protein